MRKSISIDFVLPLTPQAKQSCRFGRGRAWQPKRIRSWTARAVAELRSRVGIAVWADGPIRVPVAVEYSFEYAYSSRSGLGGWRSKRPDLGNLEKAMDDALVAAGILADDSLIVFRISRKTYSATGADRIVGRIADIEHAHKTWTVRRGLRGPQERHRVRVLRPQ